MQADRVLAAASGSRASSRTTDTRPPRTSTPTSTREVKADERLVEQLRVGEGGGAEHHARRARRERPPDRARSTAARRRSSTGTSSSRGDPLEVVQVRPARPRARRRGRPRAGSARPASTNERGGLERVVGVDGLARRSGPAAAGRPCRRGCPPPAAGSRRVSATKFASRRSPSGPDFSGWNCSAVDAGGRATDADELAAVLGGAEHVLAVRRAAARTSARGRRPPGRAGPSLSGDVAPPRHRVPADLGHLQAGRLEPHAPGPRSRPMPSAPPSSVVRLEQQLHAHADADHRHAGGRAARAAARRARARARAPSPSASRPTPGQHDRVGLAHARVVGVSSGCGADVLERLLDRAQVAHPVVEDRDSRSQQALGGRHARHASGPSATACAQRPRERLERTPRPCGARSVPALDASRAPSASRVGHRADELLDQVGLEVRRSRSAGNSAVERRERPAGDVDRAADARASSIGTTACRSARCRRGRRAPRRAPGRARCRCPPRCGARRSEVALRAHVQVEPAVAGQRVEHVVEEADAGACARPRPCRRAPSDSATSVSPVMRWISAVRLMRVGAPSTRRGRGSPRRARARRRAGASRAAASSGKDTRAIRRRNVRGERALGEARGAAGGQHVVGPGDVVAERRAGARADEDAARARHAIGQRLGLVADQLEVLGRELLGEPQRARRRPARRHRQQRVGRPSAARRRAARRPRRPCPAGAASGEISHERAVRAVLGLRQQVERDQLGSASLGRDTTQLARPRHAVDADLAEHLALGLLRPTGCRARRSRRPAGTTPSRTPARRSPGRRPPVDLVDSAERAGGQDHRVDARLGPRRGADRDLARRPPRAP